MDVKIYLALCNSVGACILFQQYHHKPIHGANMMVFNDLFMFW